MTKPIPGFWDGLTAPLVGFRFLNSHRSLWRYTVFPILVSLGVTFALLGALAFGGFQLFRQVDTEIVNRALPYIPVWFFRLVEVGVGLGLAVGALFVAVSFSLVLTRLFSGVFYSRLAVRVERILDSEGTHFRDLSVSAEVIDSLRGACEQLLATLFFFLIDWIPVVGPWVGLPGTILYGAYFCGREIMEYPLGLRGFRRADSGRWARAHFSPVMGLGLSVFVFQLIPGLGAIGLSSSVVGAVLLHRNIPLRR